MRFQTLFAALFIFFANIMFAMATGGGNGGDDEVLTTTIVSTTTLTTTKVLATVTKTGDPSEHTGTEYQVFTTLAPTETWFLNETSTSTGIVNGPANTSMPISPSPSATEGTGAAAGGFAGSVGLASFVGAMVVVVGMW